MLGPLSEDSSFIETIKHTVLQEIDDQLCLVDILTNPPSRKIIFTDPRIIPSATRHKGVVFVVRDTFLGEELNMMNHKSGIKTIYRGKHYFDDRLSIGIHSLSVSPSGNYLAFITGEKNNYLYKYWREQKLMIYDIKKDKVKELWRGDVAGSEGLLNPERWVQPLPWSPDGKEVLLSTPNKKIISVNISNGKQKEICNGFLPIGYIGSDILLTLEKGSGIKWSIYRHNIKTNGKEHLLIVKGPSGMRAPLLSTDKKYVSFVTCVFPGGKPRIGIYHYTFFLRLEDLKWAIIDAEITAWTEKGQAFANNDLSDPNIVN